jgi:hypothetical protein
MMSRPCRHDLARLSPQAAGGLGCKSLAGTLAHTLQDFNNVNDFIYLHRCFRFYALRGRRLNCYLNNNCYQKMIKDHRSKMRRYSHGPARQQHEPLERCAHQSHRRATMDVGLLSLTLPLHQSLRSSSRRHEIEGRRLFGAQKTQAYCNGVLQVSPAVGRGSRLRVVHQHAAAASRDGACILVNWCVSTAHAGHARRPLLQGEFPHKAVMPEPGHRRYGAHKGGGTDWTGRSSGMRLAIGELNRTSSQAALQMPVSLWNISWRGCDRAKDDPPLQRA